MASSLVFWFVFAGFLLSQATASHFRGGIITWKPDGYIQNKVIFNFRMGFRRSFSYSYYCNSAMVAQQSIVGSGDAWYADHDRGYYSRLNVSDTGYHCTDFSVNEDWTQGENTFTYTFPDEGPWLVSYSSCCWISLTNGGNGNWFLSTTVNLTRRQDNGKINSSPISALSPIVRIQRGCSKTITIPAEDSDGDKVRCRWSTGSSRECGGVCQGFSYSGTLDEERCTLRVHSNIALGWHAVAITLEDFPASTTNFHSATPFSHVSLQFLVHVASSSGPCNRAPVLIGQTPNDGSCEEVSDGDTFYSVIEAKHIDSSRRIVEIITVSPLYMNVTSLLNYTDNVGDTVYYKNVSWTPKSAQKGRHIFCFKALDVYGMESDERCITMLVGSNNTPRPNLSSRAPVTPSLSWPWGFGFVDFNITFDQQIKKPRHSKFIEIVLEDHVIYKLDTRSSSDVTIDQDSYTLRFRLPQAVLSMRGNYSITMDRGAVVGLGCSSDGPPSPGISSTTSWRFDVGVCSKGTFLQSYNCNDVNECSNPLPVLSRKKRNHLWWYRYSSVQAIYTSTSSVRSSDITPASSHTPAFSASITSAVSVSGSCPYYKNQQLNGRFTSPNYPSNYWDNAYCNLLIEAPAGLYIYLHFEAFNLESCHSCGCDYVQIFDGNSVRSARITKACSRPSDIWSSGRFLFVQFRSDGSVTRRGFSAYYYAVPYRYAFPNATAFIPITSIYSESSLISTRVFQFSSADIYSSSSPYDLSPTPASSAAVMPSMSGSCSYYLNQRYGRFTTPNYPGCYPNNQQCTWLIEATGGYNYIYLFFESFTLNCYYCQWGYCYRDYVEIFDGSSTSSPRIKKACGQLPAWEVYSSGRFLLVKFYSSWYHDQMPGFSATYRAVSYRYKFRSSALLQNSPSPVVCSSFFTAPPQPSIPSTHAISPTKSSRYIPWTASINGPCSYYLNQRYGRFTTPNYPGCYPNNQQCTWLIEAPGGYNYIYLYFESFDLYCAHCHWGWGHCHRDYVEIFDGSSTYSPRITKACGQLAPWEVYSSGRFLLVKFYSNGYYPMPGFSASYRAVSYRYSFSSAAVRQHLSSPVMCSSFVTAYPNPSIHSITPTRSSQHAPLTSSVAGSCSYYLNQRYGQFSSPNYPSNYPDNQHCTWLIEAPRGYYIYLYFGSFELEDHSTCRYDAVEIYDGHSRWSPMIRRACGRQQPCGMYSSGRWLLVQFRTDGSDTRRGFSATYYVVSYNNGNSIQQGLNSRTVLWCNPSMHTPTQAISPTKSTRYIIRTASKMGSVNIQPSSTTVMPTASRVPFVLHLPAKCQHNCVNTWGSYTCTCRQGYKLQADGKTCLDIDECETQNGGCTHQCINTPGSHYCKCRDGTTMGFDNKTCHEPGINVKCTDEAMFISLERKSFQGFDPNKLTLIYPSCRASYNDTHITLRTSLNDCGTTHNESEDTITFYNKVRSVEFSSGSVITRDQNVSIPFYCSYGKKAIVRNPSFKTWKNYVTSSEGGYGNFTFTMDMFKTSNYFTPYSYDDYPVTVNLQNRLFIQIAVESLQSNLVVFADTCKATPSSDPYSVPQYIFLQRGCGLDSTLNYSYSISSKQRFSIQAFRFIEDHPVVHLHCEVLACHRNTARSRCLQGCSRNRGRRDEDPGSESTQVYEMSSGPIRFKKKSERKVDKKAEAQTNTATITAVGAAGGVCLLLAIALAVAVIHIKKRFKGALADRNKVYAMEQFHKYVKEENDNDGFAQEDDVNGPGEQNLNMKASA